MTTTATTPETSIQAWELDTAHTHVEFAVKHLMIATVKGRFAGVTGKLTVDPADPGNFDLHVAIDATSLDTRQAQRDAHLRSADFFDVETWPDIAFTGKRIEGDPERKFTLVGDLTIRDVTREIRLAAVNAGTVKDPWGGTRIGFSATASIDRKDFGLTWNVALEAGGLTVGDEVKISIEAEFTAVEQQ